MKFLKFITALLLIGSSKQAKDQTNLCNRKSENDMDKSLARLLVLGQNELKFPENEEQFPSYCNEARRIFGRIETYSENCLNKFGRDSAKVILHSLNQEIRSVCKSGRLNKRAKTLMELAKCANQGNSRFNKNCYLTIIDKFMGAMNAQVQMRIPMTCCNFFDFLRCMEIEAESVPKCTPKVTDFLIKWLSRIFEGITTLMCSVYDDSNTQCDRIVKDTPQRNATQKRNKSVLLPLINIAMSLNDDYLPSN